MAAEEKTISHALTRGAVHLIKQLLATRGWYEGEKDGPATIVAAADLLEEELAEERFAPPADLSEKDAQNKDKVKEWDKALDEWAKIKEEFSITERKRNVVKSCLSYYVKKGFFVPSQHVAALIREFGLQ